MSYDLMTGLTITLAVDDGPPATADRDFNDVIIACHSQDPALHPFGPARNPYDFTYPEEFLVEP